MEIQIEQEEKALEIVEEQKEEYYLPANKKKLLMFQSKENVFTPFSEIPIRPIFLIQAATPKELQQPSIDMVIGDLLNDLIDKGAWIVRLHLEVLASTSHMSTHLKAS